MGGTSYNTARAYHTATSYSAKSFTETFQQSVSRQIHPSMDPTDINLRESRDSEVHPNSFPIIIALDVTGSMRDIPKAMISEDLPKIVTAIIQSGVTDAAVLFVAIGDHECDHAPLQIGQFESGDEEMNMWLERVWPEGGGGGNKGESYHLGWYFAGNYTRHDAMDKRKTKGVYISIGDEPVLPTLPQSYLKSINKGGEQASVSTEDALKAAQQLYHVHHIHINHAHRDTNINELLDQGNFHQVTNYHEVPKIIVDIVCTTQGACATPKNNPIIKEDSSKSEEEIL